MQGRQTEGKNMKKDLQTLKVGLIVPLLAVQLASAGSEGTSGGLTLLSATTARASGLGAALSASVDDISGFGYNPASLSTLKTGQASFLYQQGMVDDSFGHFMIG